MTGNHCKSKVFIGFVKRNLPDFGTIFEAPFQVTMDGPQNPLPSAIGRYEIKRLLGSGAMGCVYLAEAASYHIAPYPVKTFAFFIRIFLVV